MRQEKISVSLVMLILLLTTFGAKAQVSRLKARLEAIAATYKANTGVCISGPKSFDTLRINGSHHFPMQSVFKFQVALAILHEVDKGKLSLTQQVQIRKADLRPGTWSPIREKYPDGTAMPLSEVLGYTISQSDNNGCDLLFSIAGGTAKVNHYIHSLGIKDMQIAATETEMAAAWKVQFSNWCTPGAMVQLLQLFYDGKILSPRSRALLLQLMTETSTGPRRLKGLLPAGTTVAHKTGTSGTNNAGITAAVNDAGFITLPGGRMFTIAVFVSNTHENMDTNEHIIAAMARAAWDYFAGK